MGKAKLLLEIAGRPIVRHAVEGVRSAGLDPVLVVTGPEPAPIEAALHGLPVQIAVNPAPEAGQAGSVRAGIAALPPEVDTVLIALGDQPALDPGTIPALLAAHRSEERRVGKECRVWRGVERLKLMIPKLGCRRRDRL